MSAASIHDRSSRMGALALLLLLSALWGSSYAFIKLGIASIPPVTLIAGRTVIAGSLLLLILRWRGVAMPVDLVHWRKFFIQSLLNSAIPFTLIAWGERSLDSGLAVILNSTSPIFTFLLGSLLLRQENPTWPRLIGVIAGRCERLDRDESGEPPDDHGGPSDESAHDVDHEVAAGPDVPA